MGIGSWMAFGRGITQYCSKDGVFEVGSFRTEGERRRIEGRVG
jgi:hypothetical protein